MLQFTYGALTVGFFAVLAPLLIHLINMMRHRRVRWAAMEFLLASYKKHRKWIWLKQLLLLLMRMAVIALIVFMLAQWNPQKSWFDRLGGRITHHYVLLDDSYSMADRTGETTVFDTATQVVTRIGDQAREEGRHKFTLIRFSRVASSIAEGQETPTVDQIADLNGELVDRDFGLTLEEQRSKFQVTQLAIAPRQALEVVEEIFKQESDERRVVYVVSDFRAKEWSSPAELRSQLDTITKDDGEVQLVRCADKHNQNLAITELAPIDDTRAAGVPLFINVSVRNYGSQPATRVQVKLQTVFHDPDNLTDGVVEEMKGFGEELPTLSIDRIAPGATETRRVQVYFPKAGQHVVQATIGDDALLHDNRRYSVIDFPESDTVLVIDGTESKLNQYFLQSAFNPGNAKTGVRPEIQTTAFLQNSVPEALNRFAAIYLLDVPNLQSRSLENVKAFVKNGGGLCIFVGDHVSLKYYNKELYEDGDGLLPAPLAGNGILIPPVEENTPDIQIGDHPIFEIFRGTLNPLIRRVTIDQYMRLQDDWKPGPDMAGKVVARLHNQAPLAVERSYGNGRVVCFLTTLAPDWNNWGQDPSFVVTALKTHSYLTSVRRVDNTPVVGEALNRQLSQESFQDNVVFYTPPSDLDSKQRIEIERKASRPSTDSPIAVAKLGTVDDNGERSSETDRSGIYESIAKTLDGKPVVERIALNVDANEGDLTPVSLTSLEANLSPVKVAIKSPSDFSQSSISRPGGRAALLVMIVLIIFLLCEQLLAYSASYHPARGGIA